MLDIDKLSEEIDQQIETALKHGWCEICNKICIGGLYEADGHWVCLDCLTPVTDLAN